MTNELNNNEPEKGNQMTNDNDNRNELISLNEFTQVDEDERPFPDSDEAIRALQDVADSVDELVDECHRLRAERCEAERTILRLESQYGVAVKDRDVARVERDEARKIVCQLLEESDSGYVTLRRLAEDRGWDCYDKKENA